MTYDEARRRAVEAMLDAYSDNEWCTSAAAMGAAFDAAQRAMADAGWGRMKLPAHKAALYIAHNEHKSTYETVAAYLDFIQATAEDCGTDAEYQAIKEGDEVWRIQWYPKNPVGFDSVFAATLERALELANALAED